MMNPNQFTENTISAINLAVDISKGNMQQSIRIQKSPQLFASSGFFVEIKL